jgi:uncharacterized protein YwgA
MRWEKLSKGKDIVLSIIYLQGEIWGRTYLQKFLYLLNREKYKQQLFKFKHYKYGPFSSELSNLMTELDWMGIIEERAEKTGGLETAYRYILTEKGKKIAGRTFEEQLTALERKDLIEYTNRFKRHSATELLKYVYQQYPEVTERSEFKE